MCIETYIDIDIDTEIDIDRYRCACVCVCVCLWHVSVCMKLYRYGCMSMYAYHANCAWLLTISLCSHDLHQCDSCLISPKRQHSEPGFLSKIHLPWGWRKESTLWGTVRHSEIETGWITLANRSTGWANPIYNWVTTYSREREIHWIMHVYI